MSHPREAGAGHRLGLLRGGRAESKPPLARHCSPQGPASRKFKEYAVEKTRVTGAQNTCWSNHRLSGYLFILLCLGWNSGPYTW